MSTDANAESPPRIQADEFSDRVLSAMIEVLQAATSPEILRAQQILLQRLALAGAVVPSRIPPPLNITEVGGYINLLQKLNEPELLAQSLASALGVAGPSPPAGLAPQTPPLAFVSRSGDRPDGPLRATFPLGYSIRSDFAPALDAALGAIHDLGGQAPILTPFRALLPAVPGATAPTDCLAVLGRSFDLAPTAALNDPDADPLALAHPGDPGGAAPFEVVARQLDATAPRAAEVVPARWTAWSCDGTSCQEEAVDNRAFFPLTPLFNEAGWFQLAPPTNPTSLVRPGTWARWVNITGLVPGVTRFGDELALVFPQVQIVASAWSDQLGAVWDGTAFVAT